MKIYKAFILIIFFILIALIYSACYTGNKSRNYKVINSNEQIILADKSYSASEIAKIYQPVIRANPKYEIQKLLWTWYEVIDKSSYYEIVYYNCWENEINPDHTFDFLYKIYRALYFGYPIFDIEYFQVNINKKTAKAESYLFETSINNDYNQKIIKHYISKIKRISDTLFTNETYEKNGNKLISNNLLLKTTLNRVHLGIKTWNHLLCPISEENEGTYNVIFDSELKELSAGDYEKYKFCRKSRNTNK
ncbi:MAG: hypothetical protein HGB12_04995 [Bacteroidetes bacterium]|nr:hypothetical protein [Bacteroidota bacterium]